MKLHPDTRQSNTEVPSLLWRVSSWQTLLGVHFLCRGFLELFNKTEVNGLEPFLNLLKSRSDYRSRRKGLVTVSNHISVMDDPLIWGVLPLSFTATDGYMNHRWSFGSHDICFKGPFRSQFFTLGQTLPTHRLAHSAFGGLYQSTMVEGVRLLGKIQADRKSYVPQLWAFASPDRTGNPPHWPRDCVDPFSDLPVAPAYSSAPTDPRFYLSPSRYACNSYSWVHIFPEGMVHQASDKTMRYFKWGVSRLILEPEICPDVVPMFIEGTDEVMHESRGFPRPFPRFGKKITVTFGNAVDVESRFGDLRKKWRELVEEADRSNPLMQEPSELAVSAGDAGALMFADNAQSEKLRSSPEAVELRIECTRRVREEVLKVRRSRGLPDEDPKNGYIETWAREGPKREGQMEDGSWVKEGT